MLSGRCASRLRAQPQHVSLHFCGRLLRVLPTYLCGRQAFASLMCSCLRKVIYQEDASLSASVVCKPLSRLAFPSHDRLSGKSCRSQLRSFSNQAGSDLSQQLARHLSLTFLAPRCRSEVTLQFRCIICSPRLPAFLKQPLSGHSLHFRPKSPHVVAPLLVVFGSQ